MIFRMSGSEVLVCQTFGMSHSIQQWAASFQVLLWLELARYENPNTDSVKVRTQ